MGYLYIFDLSNCLVREHYDVTVSEYGCLFVHVSFSRTRLFIITYYSRPPQITLYPEGF